MVFLVASANQTARLAANWSKKVQPFSFANLHPCYCLVTVLCTSHMGCGKLAEEFICHLSVIHCIHLSCIDETHSPGHHCK